MALYRSGMWGGYGVPYGGYGYGGYNPYVGGVGVN